jgi:CheY-like chemotaxis protein
MAETKPKILIIDDEGELIEMLKARLEPVGYDVEFSLNGPEGIEKALTIKPDAILLDINMPEMDGWEVCKLLRENPDTANTNIILITASRRLKQARDYGANYVILKPFNFEELTDALKKITRESKNE